MKLIANVLPTITTSFTLGCFALIGYWGHRTHWTMIDHANSAHQPDHASTTHSAKRADHAAEPANGKVETRESSSDAKPLVSADAIQRVTLEPTQGTQPKSIETQAATVLPLLEQVSAIATVAYNGQKIAQLSTRVEGHVLMVYSKLGESVKRGDVLALVDSQTVGEAKSDWLQKAASARYRKRVMEQLQQTGDGVVPLKRIREAEAELKDADLASFMAQQRMMNLGFVIDFELNLDTPPEQLAEQVRYMGVPKELIDALPTRPSTANLIAVVAPFDGVVVEQHAVAGEMVSPTSAQFVVADTSVMWVKLSVRREDANKLRVGQEVEFLPDGISEPISTKLAWINAEIDAETRTLQAGCEIDNPIQADRNYSSGVPTRTNDTNAGSHRLLRANQFGNAKIVVAQTRDAVLVPTTAIQRMPDQSTIVFVAADRENDFEIRRVEVGLHHNGMVQILSGVSAGEFVVSSGSFILKSELMRSSLVGG